MQLVAVTMYTASVIISFLAVTSIATSTLYHIVPDDHMCQLYSTDRCMSLAQFGSLSNPSVDDALTMVLSSGVHRLDRYISLVNISNVSIAGGNTVVNVTGSSGFIVSNVHTLDIAGLVMIICGQTVLKISQTKRVTIQDCNIQTGIENEEISEQVHVAIQVRQTESMLVLRSSFTNNRIQQQNITSSYIRGGALSVVGAHDFTIAKSNFTENQARGLTQINGGVIHLEEIKNVMILDSILKENKATCTKCQVDIRGGVLFVRNAHLFQIINTTFVGNKASNTFRYSLGGAVYAEVDFISISGCQFTSNKADYGGSIYVRRGTLSSSNNDYTSNHVEMDGGAVAMTMNVATCSFGSDNYTGNRANGDGGGIWVSVTNMTISNCYFTNNRAEFNGGAFSAFLTTGGQFQSTQNKFTHNTANYKGGAGHVTHVDKGYYTSTQNTINNTSEDQAGASYITMGKYGLYNCSQNLYLSNTANMGGALVEQLDNTGYYYSQKNEFIRNIAKNFGGAVSLFLGNHGYYHSIDNLFSQNSADDIRGGGGGVHTHVTDNATYNSSQNRFRHNFAAYVGGGMDVILRDNGSYYSVQNMFHSNSVKHTGGGVNVGFYDNGEYRYTSSHDHFLNNRAHSGGGVHVGFDRNVGNGVYRSSHNLFVNNSAVYYGGAVEVVHGNYFSAKDIYTNNTGYVGGAVATFQDFANIEQAIFTSNQATLAGAALHVIDGDAKISNCVFEDNSQRNVTTVSIVGTTLTSHNSSYIHNEGNALYMLDSTVELSGVNIFTGNKNGAIVSTQSFLVFRNSRVIIANNEAKLGGGLFLAESQLHIYCRVTLQGNTATHAGGAIYTYQSKIIFHSEQGMQISQNTAVTKQAGGVSLIASIFKVSRGTVNISNNTGVHGGAMFLEQNSRVYVYNVSFTPDDIAIGRVAFTSNTAYNGGALYVVDSTAAGTVCEKRDEQAEQLQTECFMQTLTLNTAINLDAPLHHASHHHDYTFISFTNNRAKYKGNDIYGGLLDRCSPSVEAYSQNVTGLNYIRAMAFFGHDNRNGMKLSTNELKEHFASDAVQVCFCTAGNTYDCTVMEQNVFTRRGATFGVEVTAVDHIQTQMAATVLAAFSLNSSIGRFKEKQVKRGISNKCTKLLYNVYSDKPTIQIDLYADGPCGNRGISKRIVNVTFLPCDCPIGFQPSKSATECICECVTELSTVAICSEDKLIQLIQNKWVGYVNESESNNGLIIHHCPFDYCQPRPVNITFEVNGGPDMQCAYNRTKLLCGQCKYGLSLVLGSSKCKPCTNQYLSLIVPFAGIGILLVAFILILNMTVAIGTIHGLIFYANIIGAAKPVFFSGQETVFIRVFISWLNLDFGIETCFYDGMDSNTKVLLQLAFPSYLILLTIIIIVFCEYSKRFATLLAHKNPVATLSTLVLLSYSKLLDTIIAALQYTHLKQPDGSYKIAWLFDANMPYFGSSHRILLFVFSLFIIVLGAIYTILLFFGQWLTRFSDRKLMKWTKHPKYNAFIDAYHAPFDPKHRYWVGLLLFIRIAQNILQTLIAEQSVTILSIICIAIFLVALKILNTRIYKNWALDTLESFFLINIIVLSAATYHVRESNGNQSAVIITSISIVAITFLAILGYHVYDCMLKNTETWKKLRRIFTRRQYRDYELVALIQDSSDSEDSVFEDTQSVDSYTGRTVNTPPPCIEPHLLYDPPIIQSAVRLDQLREPALDVLDPVTDDHYREVWRRPHPPPPPRRITSQIVDIQT